MGKQLLGCTLTIAIAAPLAAAWSPVAAQGVAAIEEIVVTARRKDESLQETPISITAVTAEGIEARGLTKVDQITQVAPNVVFEPTAPLTGSSNNGSMFIRGIGTTEFSLASDTGVGLYVDDVYLARTSGNVMDIVDVEAIEVLRGPQGTLFGRNSVGGAIVIRSKRPDDEFSGRAIAEYGTDNLWSIGGTVNIPLHDTLRTRASFQRRDQDGYVDDIAGVEDFGERSSWVARGTIEWAPTDIFMATARLDYTRENNSAAPYVLVDLFDTDPLTGAPTFVALQNLLLASRGAPCVSSAGNTGGSCVDQHYVRGPHETVFGYSTNDPFLNNFNEEPFQSKDFTEVFGASVTLELDLDFATIKSVTAYRQVEARNPRNPDHTPFNVLEANSDLEQDQISTELQIAGQAFDDRLDWITGFFYMKEEGFQLDSVALQPLTLFSGGDFTNENWAVFGQASFDITESLELTFGIRHTQEDKTFRTISNNFLFGQTQVLVSVRPNPTTDDKVPFAPPIVLFDTPTPLEISEQNYHASLAWFINDDVMTYASYSRGYKAGGFEQRIAEPPPGGEARTFGPEFADAYEIGVKSTWFDRRLRVNGSLFYTDYQDIQCAVVIGIAPITINCGDAEIYGVELDANWVPATGWLVDFSMGWLDASWAGGTLTPLASTVGILESNDLAMIPELTTAAGLSYEFAMDNAGTITPRLDWSYRSEISKDAANTPELVQDGFHLLNISLIWNSPSDKYQVALRGNNITDEVYIMTGVSQPNGGFTEAVYARGAVWSASFQARF